MTPEALEEYKALRSTIRERGTARVWVFTAGLVAWGALTIATAALAALPVATLLPLLVLAGFFEAVYSLHVGVERVGRYVQVFYESATEGANPPSSSGPTWEHAAMTFGAPAGAARVDALFSAYFIAAGILNIVPAVIAQPVALEVTVVGAAHLLFIARVVAGRRVAGRQRIVDLERFRQIKRESGSPGRA